MSVETAVKENVDTKDEPESNDEEMEDASDTESGDKKKEKPKKKKYTDWPLKGIKEPHDHDVLYGRGGGTKAKQGCVSVALCCIVRLCKQQDTRTVI